MRFAFLLLALGWLAVLPGQTPAFLHYGVRDGLPGNIVYAGLQDDEGLLWFGTDKGLVRFDGTRFESFDMEEGLPDPEVLGLATDAAKRLWIICFQQRPCYRQNGRLVTAEEDPRLLNLQNRLWCEVYRDKAGQTWFASVGQCTRFDADSVRSWPTVTAWFAEFDQRFFLLAGHEIKELLPNDSVAYVQPLVESKIREHLYRCARVSGNRLLYAYHNLLVLLEYDGRGFRQVEQRPFVGGLVFVDTRGRFWVCSETGGVTCFDNQNRDLSNPVTYFGNTKINRVFEDNQGTLWFCSFGEGVYALPRQSPIVYGLADGLRSKNVTALALDTDGALLAGDDRGFLYRISNRVEAPRHYNYQPGYNRMRQISVGPDGTRWVATDNDVYRDKGGQPRRSHTEGSIKTIALAPSRLWYGSGSRLGYIEPGSGKSITLIHARFTAIHHDSDGNLWAGGIDGLYSERDGFQHNWNEDFPELKGRITAIAAARPGQLWIATPGRGLLRVTVRAGTVQHVDAVRHGPNHSFKNIQAIFAEPEKNRVWLATNRGVYGLEGDQVVRHLDSRVGLASDDVNAVLVKGDTLWAGTVSGLSQVILRETDAENNFPTRITRIRFQANNQAQVLNLLDTVPDGNWNLLPPDASLVELELAGLDFRGHGGLRYQCILTKLPPPFPWWTFSNLMTWISAGFQPSVDTAMTEDATLRFGVQLASGRYQVQATAINADNRPSDQPDYWTIVKMPYWYQCIWTWLLVLGVLNLLAIRWFRTRLHNRLLLAAVSELQLQALRAQINPHFIGNSINAIQQFFFPPDPVTASEYIALFNRLLRHTMQLSEQHFITFDEELRYERDYLEMIQLRFGARFQYAIDGADCVPPDTPFPSMVLQPIIENATIHGLAEEGVSRLRITFARDGEKLVCTVTDNGIGLHEAAARKRLASLERKSKGLELLMRKIETLNKLFDLRMTLDLQDRSEINAATHGTSVVLTFDPHRAPAAKRAEKIRNLKFEI